MARIRSYSRSDVGNVRQGSGPLQPQSRVSHSGNMTDTVGNPGGDNPMLLTKFDIYGGRLNGKGSLTAEFFDCPVSYSSGGFLTLPPDNGYVNRIMASSGPLTPKLYLPVAIFELKDIPKMLKDAGDMLHHLRKPPKLGDPAHEIASANLAYQFGWKPLMDDIGKMLDFTDVVNKRIRTIKKSHTQHGVKRRVTLESASSSSTATETVFSTFGNIVTQSVAVTKTAERWATMRWKARSDFEAKEATFTEAFKISYGLNPGYLPLEVWKAMPWSWAIDWFTDISNVVASGHNMVYYLPSQINVMTHMRTVKQYGAKVSTNPATLRLSGGQRVDESKARSIQAPVPGISLRLPFLDNFKLSIVSSMAIYRIKKSGR
jgi:hypothetical protein